jgi:rubredoxin
VRQLDSYVGAAAGPARHGNRPAESFDDIPRNRQTESCAGPAGGEERVEDAREIRCRNPDSLIPDLDGNAVPGRP